MLQKACQSFLLADIDKKHSIDVIHRDTLHLLFYHLIGYEYNFFCKNLLKPKIFRNFAAYFKKISKTKIT